MQIIKWAVRAVFVSYEFLIIILSVAVHYTCPEVENITAGMFENSKAEYICFFPVGLAGYAMKCASSILTPCHDKRPALTEWPNRQWITACTITGIIYVVGAAAMSALMFFVDGVLSQGTRSIVVASSILVACVSTVSMYFAQHKIMQMLDSMKQ